MRVALRMVASRWAMTNVVRPFMTSTSAACTLASVSASRALVASSKIRIGGCLSNAGAQPASVADGGIEARRILDDVERLRARAGFAHLLLGGVRLADQQVFPDR